MREYLEPHRLSVDIELMNNCIKIFLPLGQGKLKGRTDTLSIIMYNYVVVGKN